MSVTVASRRVAARIVLTALAVLPLGATIPARAADWPVFDHDPARSGYGAGDRALAPANVGTLRRRWVVTYPDVADSTPILLTNVRLPRGGLAPLLFQTTRHGTTYAVNAATGAIVWQFATRPPTMYPQSPNDVASKITTSTPVADPSGRYIYVPGRDGYVHKLVAATGAEVRGLGFPLQITRMPDVEKNAAALNLANGYLYAATSGYIGDQGPYDGHVVALRLRDGQTRVFNSLCSANHRLLLDKSYGGGSAETCASHESGIWARGGVVVDPDPHMAGRVYVATGNGPFDAARGGSNFGDSVIALSADGARLLDSFTPATYDALESGDTDLGSTAPVLLPREPGSRTPLMAIQGGKDGLIRLLNRAHLGGVHGELQDLSAPGATLFSAPAVWRMPGSGTWIYLGDSSNVTALRLQTRGGASRLYVAWTASASGTSPVVVGGVVFAATSGALNAFDARTGRLLWSSTQSAAGGTIGGIHWESPIAVNGCAFISDETSHLTAYALPGHSCR